LYSPSPPLEATTGIDLWSGLIGCPSPYVTERIIAPSDGVPGQHIVKENAAPLHLYDRPLYPKWGAMLRDENTGQVEELRKRGRVAMMGITAQFPLKGDI